MILQKHACSWLQTVMFFFLNSIYQYIINKPFRVFTFLIVSVALSACSGDGDQDGDGSATGVVTGNESGNGSESDDQLVPDNELTEIYGDWITGCIPESNAEGEIVHHAVYSYSITQDTWTETNDQYAVDDPLCSNWLGAAGYTYQYEVLSTATAATLNGSFFGNAVNVDIIDTMEDVFGQAEAEDLGAASAIWLVKNDKLYSRLDITGTRPNELLEKYAFTRL